MQTHEIASRPAATIGFENLVTRLEMAVGQNGSTVTDVEFFLEHHRQVHETNPVDYPSLIGRLQAETAALVAILLRRIEALDEEMAVLRERLDTEDREKTRTNGPPVEKLRWDLIPPSDPEAKTTAESGSWLIDRLRQLEAERQTTWTNLVGRISPQKSAD